MRSLLNSESCNCSADTFIFKKALVPFITHHGRNWLKIKYVYRSAAPVGDWGPLSGGLEYKEYKQYSVKVYYTDKLVLWIYFQKCTHRRHVSQWCFRGALGKFPYPAVIPPVRMNRSSCASLSLFLYCVASGESGNPVHDFLYLPFLQPWTIPFAICNRPT